MTAPLEKGLLLWQPLLEQMVLLMQEEAGITHPKLLCHPQ
jgi:hypothetical protein